MASTLLSHWRRRKVCSIPPVIANEPRSLNDMPDEILLKVISQFGPEDLCLLIAKVCGRWNALSKDVALWKSLSYSCDESSDINRIAGVRCTTLLGFRTNYLRNFTPSSVLKVRNLKENFRNWTSFHPK